MSDKKLLDLEVKNNQKICSDIYLMELKADKFAYSIKPGQFVHVSCNNQNETYLRRPLSIFDVDFENNTISLLYKVVGKGTSHFSTLKPGDMVNLMGPLGNSFSLDYQKPLIIGGGIGVAPLKFLVRKFNEKNVQPDVVLGFSENDQLEIVNLFKDVKCNLHISTDEISQYFCGNSCQLASIVLEKQDFDAIFACGPKIMLQNIPQTNLPTYISLEEYMACGVGACLGCAVKNSDGGYSHVCKDGPIFEAKGVVINE
ncbi:MAG: dihydroorotate dehydrogenase electron transfer subunit [Clostridia bacterium]